MKTVRFGPLVILILLVLATVAFAEAPAPFCAAKMHAMSMPVDEDGDYIWEFSADKDGEQVHYALVYLTETKAILIIREPVICAYNEITGEIQAGIFMGMVLMPINRPAEEIIEFAFEIFRELVEADAFVTII